MIYIKRILWVLFYLPALVITSILFFLVLIWFPCVVAFYYIKDGNIDNFPEKLCLWNPDAIFDWYQELKP